MTYSENELKLLARNNPKELARILISPNINAHNLTFGAEILGEEVSDETIVLPVLRKLLKHINAVVREGAMIGIMAYFKNTLPPQDILERLEVMAKQDPSHDLKDIAKDMLQTFNESKIHATNV